MNIFENSIHDSESTKKAKAEALSKIKVARTDILLRIVFIICSTAVICTFFICLAVIVWKG